MYELELDNGVIVDTYEEVILAHNLLITKNINDIDYISIEKDNKYYDCYYKALKLIKAVSLGSRSKAASICSNALLKSSCSNKNCA